MKSSSSTVIPVDPLSRLVDQIAHTFCLKSPNFLKISKALRYGDLWLSSEQLCSSEATGNSQLIQHVKRDCIPQQIFLNRSFVIHLLLPEIIPDGVHLLPWSSYLKIQRECSIGIVCVVQQDFQHLGELRSLLFASCAYSLLSQVGVSTRFYIYMTPVEAASLVEKVSSFSNLFRSLGEALSQQATAVYREPLEWPAVELLNRYYDSKRQMFCLSLLSQYHPLPSWCYPLQDWYAPMNSYRYRMFGYLYHLLATQMDVDRMLLFTSPQQTHLMKQSMLAAALYQPFASPIILLDKIKWIPCGATYDHLDECTDSHVGNENTDCAFVSARCIHSLWGGKVSHPTHLFCPMHSHHSFVVDKWLYQYARMATLSQSIPRQHVDYSLSFIHPIEWNIFYENILSYYRILPSLCQQLVNHSCSTTTTFHLLTEWLAKTTSHFTQLYSQLRIVIEKEPNHTKTTNSSFVLRQCLVIVLQQQMKHIFQLLHITPMETI